MKICTNCRNSKPLDSFPHNRSSRYKDRRYPICKDCLKILRNNPPQMHGEKICSVCSQKKEIKLFCACRGSKDGRLPQCKDCTKRKKLKLNFSKPDVGTKQCRKCYRILDYKFFHRRKDMKDGCNVYCKDCEVLRKYGMSFLDYNLMCEKQNHKCKLCNKQKKLVVDHNHFSKKVRGLLCLSCNCALGVFGDSVDSFNKVIEYLRG